MPKIEDFRIKVKEEFENEDFYASFFHFEHIVPDDEFRNNINENFGETNAAQILIYAPDLFIYPSKKGVSVVNTCMFVICARKKEINEDQKKILEKYYPFDKVSLAYPDDNGNPLILWLKDFSKVKNGKSIQSFIESIPE